MCIFVHLCALSWPLLTWATSNIKHWLGSETDHIHQKRLNLNSSCGGSWRTNSLFMADFWTQAENQLRLTLFFLLQCFFKRRVCFWGETSHYSIEMEHTGVIQWCLQAILYSVPEWKSWYLLTTGVSFANSLGEKNIQTELDNILVSTSKSICLFVENV